MKCLTWLVLPMILLLTISSPAWAQKKNAAGSIDNSQLFANPFLLSSDTTGLNLVKDTQAIASLNTFIYSAIYQRAFPGCQILAAKDGKIIFNKCFGTLDYNSAHRVTDTTLYDIASVTKIMATTLALMKLYDEGKLILNSNLLAYIPDLVKGSDKAYMRIDDLMMHQAGLKSWIPFYKATLDKEQGGGDRNIYHKRAGKQYGIAVAKDMYILNTYPDTIWKTIMDSRLENKGRYVYSDLDLMFLQKVVEAITQMPLDEYVEQHFYQPMGLRLTMFNPWKQGLTEQCAPTENDMIFREQVVRGYVHDPGAAMLGGVAGHAGVFSTKAELAVILQMLLNGGEYNGTTYLSRSTIQLFTNYHSTISRRGYCFDKPNKEPGSGGPAADICNKTAFGHQGFTGTCVWADPATGILFIFLSNRVYPSADNKLIGRLDIRTKAQEYIYKALGY